ncbi:sperm-associated antigen 1A [Ditylenchus destructor]|nr:sperm-associated antigen 1A [Ditylenchus destructor]
MAEKTLERAMAIKEEGNAYFLNKEFHKAITTYTLCLAMKDRITFYNNRAAAYMKLEMFDMALFDLNNALQFETNQKAMKRRIVCLKSLNRIKDAHAAVKEYLARFRDESEEFRAISMDICQVVRNSPHKFDSLLISNANDRVTVVLEEGFNGKCILYDLEKQKSTVQAQLAAHPIELIVIHGITLDGELADLLNQIDSAYLRDSTSSNFEIYDVNFSLMPKGTFNKLFGQLLRPNCLSFFGVRGIDGCSFMRNVKNFGSKYVEVMPAFQVETFRITYRLIIFCRLTDVHEWIQGLFKRRVLKAEDIERVFDALFKNTEATPEEMINEYNEATKQRFVVKIRKCLRSIEMKMTSMLDSKVKSDDFNVSVQIYREI